MKLSLTLVCTFSILAAARAEPPPVEPRDAVSLLEVTRSVLARNPSIQAARARWREMRERVPQAAAWEDLLVGADFERTGATRFDTYSDIEYMAMQAIPVSGKNRSRARIADAEALETLEEFRRTQLDLVGRGRAAYFALANAREQLAVNERNVALLTQFTEISRRKYEAGLRSQAEVLLAETEQVKLLEQRVDLRRKLSEAETALNVLTNQPARTPVGRAELRFTSYAPEPERLRTLTIANRPELQAARQRIAAGNGKVELARRAWIPDPQIRVEARQFRSGDREGLSEYDTGIFFSVPWGNAGKYRAGQREAKNGLEKAQLDLDAATNDALGALRDQLAKIETFHHHYELFRDRLLPLAQQTVNASQIGYESDKGGFLDLVTAQRGAQDIESTYYDHLADYQIALAELEAIVGADLKIFPLPPTPGAGPAK